MSFSNNFSDTKEKLSDADHKKYTRVLKYLDRTLKRLSVDTRFEVYDQYVNHDRKVSDFYGFDIIHEEGRWNSLPEYTLYFNGKEALKVNGRGPDIEGKYEIELEKPLDTNAALDPSVQFLDNIRLACSGRPKSLLYFPVFVFSF